MTLEHDNKPLALILGATGGIGGAVARRLHDEGWAIRALTRDTDKASATERRFDWVKGDAMNAGDVLSAAAGASLVFHAVNPPGYRDWDKLVLPMLDNTIAAARAVGATILLPGTVYNFGPDAFPVLYVDAPQNPVTRKGAIRVEMERRLEAAARQGTQAIIVRAGDFFGPAAGNNWFSQGLVTPGKPVTSVMSPGLSGVGHQWAYLPDVAETMVRLVLKREDLPAFAVYHMEGFWDADGEGMVATIRRASGNRSLKVRHFPWWLVPLAAPFVPFLREVREMRYLWREALRMPNDRLVAVLGEEPHTPIDVAVHRTLESLGCLEQSTAIAPRPATQRAIGRSA